MTLPPAAFAFEIRIAGDAHGVVAQEVSGLEAAAERREADKGMVHALPPAADHVNLFLKRMILATDAALLTWARDTVQGTLTTPLQTKDIEVSLLDSKQTVLRGWTVTSAYPVKLTLGPFDAMKNEIAVEALELAYAKITRHPPQAV